STQGPELPIYWGNRNWHPLLADTLKQMADDGIRNALAFVTSAYGSYSGCRQYLENIKEARDLVGPYAPEVEKLRIFFNHPGFIKANSDHLLQSLQQLPEERRSKAKVIFTAHSIPKSMSDGCQYANQLREASQLVSDAVNHKDWGLVYQSRSGPASQPWLSPDICDYLEDVAACGYNDVIVLPIGFVSDHLEVIYDIDTQAKEKADELKINLIRAATSGVHPSFVAMIRDLILEKTADDEPKASGTFGLVPEQCQANCCVYTPAPARRI
ncbi:MAG: ferrochelatase, partial [Candidatus Obscuribacterales bacterium]|nr:ferrochelatase [Candidatus Obscuribacterales bacterium]